MNECFVCHEGVYIAQNFVYLNGKEKLIACSFSVPVDPTSEEIDDACKRMADEVSSALQARFKVGLWKDLEDKKC